MDLGFTVHGPVHNACDAGRYITTLQGQEGGGALEVETFLGQKIKSRYSGPNPLPLAQVIDLPPSKELRTHCPPHISNRVRVREHSAVNFSYHTAPPPPPQCSRLKSQSLSEINRKLKCTESNALVHKNIQHFFLF
jgi:hypothetical protein